MGTFKLAINVEENYATSLVSKGIAGENLNSGKICFLDNDGKWYLASASNQDILDRELRIVLFDIIENQEGLLLEQGTVVSLGLVKGTLYYLSNTSGEATNISPSNKIYIGTAESDSKLKFNPSIKSNTSSSVFNSNLSSSLEIPDEWEENVEGLTISDLQGKTSTEVIETLFFPTVSAYISSQNSITVSGQSTSIVEVGTGVSHTITINYNTGQINNGDNSIAGPLNGALDSVTVLDPSSTNVYSNNSIVGNSDSTILPSFNTLLGVNNWTVQATNLAGTTTYNDNKGNSQTITSIENEKNDLSPDNKIFTVNARYNRWYYLGNQNTSPIDSIGVRNLNTNQFLSSNNTDSFSLNIPSGTQEVTIYYPLGKSLSVIDAGNLNNDLSNSFIKTNININDANSSPVAYEKATIFLGLGGFPSNTNFNITII